ncbi:MAG: hypothetical protein ACHQQ3_03510 [Gemmatimonadales bacterium]
MLLPVLLLLLQAVAPQAPLPDVVTHSRIDRSRGVDFHARVSPDTVYVGQQATYQLGVFLDQETRQRLRRNPEFLPPESRSMLAYDLPERGGALSVAIDGRPYEVHVFRRALFPLTPGRYEIPAARLTYALPQSPSFFSREETFSLRAEAATLVAIDPPLAGRPGDWTGAVGVWRATARVDSARGRAGDPLVLTLRIEGQGNVTLLPRPALSVSWANVVPADERVRLDSTPTALRGSKEFDWLVTPGTAGAQRIPAIRFSYFNPFTRRYEVALSEAFGVRVAAGDVVALAGPVEAPAGTAPLSLIGALDEEAPYPLGDLPLVRWLLALAPLPALAGWIATRPRRVPRVSTPMERLSAMQDMRAREFAPAEVRRALLEGLRARTGLDAAALAQPGAWTRGLRHAGVRDETAREAETLLDRLDSASFGGAAPGGVADLATRAADVLRLVGEEATPRVAPRATMVRALSFGVGLALAGSGALFARSLQRAQAPFAQGITAYAGADYVRAARLFEDAAREVPRSSAAWANAGTASWAIHDTALAVVGWQRGLRLDPTSAELRDRLALVRAPQDVGVARVPNLPARGPSALALLLWVLGWALVARQTWRRHPALPVAVLTLVVAGVLGASARVFEDRLEGRNLAVVTDPGPLRAVPSLGAEGGAAPIVGEVARVVRRQGVWTHVAFDGGRDGWIATERLAPLGRN